MKKGTTKNAAKKPLGKTAMKKTRGGNMSSSTVAAGDTWPLGQTSR